MTVKEFFELTAEDEELVAKLQLCKSPEEAYALAKDKGVTDAMDEFVKYAEELNNRSKDMTPEEIESVSAAGDTMTTTTIYNPSPSATASV